MSAIQTLRELRETPHGQTFLQWLEEKLSRRKDQLAEGDPECRQLQQMLTELKSNPPEPRDEQW